jgi:hypothetical protein
LDSEFKILAIYKSIATKNFVRPCFLVCFEKHSAEKYGKLGFLENAGDTNRIHFNTEIRAHGGVNLFFHQRQFHILDVILSIWPFL